jgi:CheY-like chemotaxis protein
MEAVGALAGGIAHDFNNLLQIVMGYSEFMIQQKEEGEKDYADLQKIIEAGHRGTELVKSLMMFSRKAEIKPKLINFNDQVEQLTKMLARIIPKMISIDLDLAPDLTMINADPTQMDQVVMNLAVNARDAMGDQGKLTIKTENLILDDEYCKTHVGVVPGSYVAITISDTGCGMDKETLTCIFDPFFTTKVKGKGTGLGLSTVYGIVKQHNGFISCESDPGHGATFKIYLPAILPKQESCEDVAGETSPRGGTETILVVDDEESLRVMVGRILSTAGYTVLTARDGEEALDLYKRGPAKISLVILDLMMPKMSGQKCLEELLRIDPKAKILISTGVSPGDEQTKLVIDSRFSGFIHKPYDNTKLLSVVRTLLDTD